jgi:hypothetical protein
LEVSGQLHTPAVLLPGKELPIPIGDEVGCTPEPVWITWRKIFLPTGIELLQLRRPVVSRYTDWAIPAVFNMLFVSVTFKFCIESGLVYSFHLWTRDFGFSYRFQKIHFSYYNPFFEECSLVG